MPLDSRRSRLALGDAFEDDARWYVAYAKPHKESYAAGNLRQQGFKAFFPQISKSVSHARRTRIVKRPLFPRYIFVNLDLSVDRWRSVLGTFGVATMIFDRDRPKAAPQGLVEQLILADELGYPTSVPSDLSVGDRVRILSGPFAERVGTLVAEDESERVRILLELLGAERVFGVEKRHIVRAVG